MVAEMSGKGNVASLRICRNSGMKFLCFCCRAQSALGAHCHHREEPSEQPLRCEAEPVVLCDQLANVAVKSCCLQSLSGKGPWSLALQVVGDEDQPAQNSEQVFSKCNCEVGQAGARNQGAPDVIAGE